MKKIISLLAISMMLPFISIKAQTPCDFNNNGFIDVADLVRFWNEVGGNPGLDSLPDYWPSGDCDGDSIDVTLSDGIAMSLSAIGVDPRGEHFESFLDTIYIPDITASPGQGLLLPVYVRTERILEGLQFYLIYDSNSLNISEVVQPDSLPTRPGNSGGYLFDGGASVVEIYENPYAHDVPVAFLRVLISPDFPAPGEIHLTFGNDRTRILYTGLSEVDSLAVPPNPNIMFISPVMIGSTISILPTGIDENRNSNNDRISLEIYGNPANVTYLIRYYLPIYSHANLALYDILGRQVAILVDEDESQGYHEASWNAGNRASGIYFCRLSTDHEAITKKMTLMK